MLETVMSCNVRLLAEVNREGRLPVPWHLISTVGHGTEGGPPAFSRTYKRANISRQRQRDDPCAASIRPALRPGQYKHSNAGAGPLTAARKGFRLCITSPVSLPKDRRMQRITVG
jgi:hypothetical protein